MRARLAAPVTRAAALAAAVALAANLFIPAARPEIAGFVPAPWDKLLHLVYFFALAMLLSVADAGRRPIFVAMIAVAVGGADEWNQTFQPERDASLADFLADCLGAAAGAAAGRWLIPRGAGAR
jgi:VanZ family protein